MIARLLRNGVRFIPWSVRNKIKSIPVVAMLQRRLLARFVEGSEFVHRITAGPAKGLCYPVILPDDKGVWTGNYEVQFVTGLVEATKSDSLCFDVGGWRGYCGGAMAARGAKQVVIFEPLPNNCRRIRRMIELNPSLRIRLVESAVGESDGSATFTVMDASSMGKLADSPFQREVSSGDCIAVDVVSLDGWCKQHEISDPQVVKVDVEGAEMMVLRGAEGMLRRSMPMLFIEAHSRQLTTDVIGFLSPMGYEIRILETGRHPDGITEPEVCHLVARATADVPMPTSDKSLPAGDH